MDKFPRRTILIGGSLLLTFFLVICAVLMMPSIAPDVPQSLAAVPLFLYMKVESGTRAQLKGPPHPPPPLLVRRAGFELSLGPLLWLLLSELYPLSIRGVASALRSQILAPPCFLPTPPWRPLLPACLPAPSVLLLLQWPWGRRPAGSSPSP